MKVKALKKARSVEEGGAAGGVKAEKEFKGEFRSEEWREARKKKKYERKAAKKGGAKAWTWDEGRSGAVERREEVEKLVEERAKMRAARKWEEADDARVHLSMDFGVAVDDEKGLWWVEKVSP